AHTAQYTSRALEKGLATPRLRRGNTELPANRARQRTVDLPVARNRRAPTAVFTGCPDRVPRAFADFLAAIRGEVPFELAELHSATVTRRNSLLASAGSGLGSPSSRYERTSSRN